MATMTESDFQRKLAGNFRISPADLARLSPEQQQLYQQKMLQAAAPASLQGAFGAPQAAAGGVPVDHAHGATLAQIAANQQAQLEQLNKAGMLGGIRQSPKDTNYNAKPGLDYLRSADEVAARQDAWQQHTGAKDALRMQSARDAVSAKKDEQSKRVSQSVFGPDGVAHTAGGGRVMMMPDGSFGYSNPAGHVKVNPSQVYNAPGGPMSVGEARALGADVNKNGLYALNAAADKLGKKKSKALKPMLEGGYAAAQMDAENVRAQDRKATALDMLASAQMPEQNKGPTGGSNGKHGKDRMWDALAKGLGVPGLIDTAKNFTVDSKEGANSNSWRGILGKLPDAYAGAKALMGMGDQSNEPSWFDSLLNKLDSGYSSMVPDTVMPPEVVPESPNNSQPLFGPVGQVDAGINKPGVAAAAQGSQAQEPPNPVQLSDNAYNSMFDIANFPAKFYQAFTGASALAQGAAAPVQAGAQAVIDWLMNLIGSKTTNTLDSVRQNVGASMAPVIAQPGFDFSNPQSYFPPVSPNALTPAEEEALRQQGIQLD